MFKTKCKKTVSKMILSFILITLTLLSGCQKNTTHSAIEFGTIDVSEIDKTFWHNRWERWKFFLYTVRSGKEGVRPFAESS